MNWRDVTTSAQIKKQLPLEYVCYVEGINLETTYDGRLVGRCPFHDDTRPSFAVFGNDLEKVGCWSCDFHQGDVFELLQRIHDCGFNEAVRRAQLYLHDFKEDDEWKAKPRTVFESNPETLRDVARQAWVSGAMDLGPLNDCIIVKRWEFDAEWLHQTWWVGVSVPNAVIIPHLSAGMRVTGVKLRQRALSPYAIAGSRFPQLYGSWLEKKSHKLLLCEGESDAWTAAWRYHDYDVRAVPTGAGTYPRDDLVLPLRDWSEVVIPWDGDDAGRAGAARWAEALGKRARVVDLPDEEDVTSWKELQLP